MTNGGAWRRTRDERAIAGLASGVGQFVTLGDRRARLGSVSGTAEPSLGVNCGPGGPGIRYEGSVFATITRVTASLTERFLSSRDSPKGSPFRPSAGSCGGIEECRGALTPVSGRVEVVLDHGPGFGLVEVESFAIDFLPARSPAGGRRSRAAQPSRGTRGPEA
jgi:hypothetical protein